jgi:hypothetical protein
MAYAFNRLNVALGQPEQSDIFGGNQPQDMGQQPAGVGGMQRSASTGGAAVGQGGGSGPAPVADGPATSVAPNVFQQISERNKPQELGAIGDISTGIASSVQKAQTEADKYVAGQKVKAPTDKDVAKAGKGNESAFSNIAQFLGGAPAVAQDFDTTAELDNANIEALGSRTGVAGLIAKQAGTGYDPRLGNFDASLTMADQGFQKSKADIDKQAAKAEKQLGNIDAKAEKDAQKALSNKEKAARKALLAQIQSLRDAEIAQAEEAMQFERDRRQGMGSSLAPADNAARTAAGNQGMAASYAELAKDPSLAPYLDRARFDMNDANPYIGINQDVGGIGAYLGDSDRAQFNRLNDLFALGGGKRAAELADPGTKTGAYNFNQAAYSQALRAAAERIKSGQKPAESGTGKTTKETGGKGPGGPAIYANPAGAVSKTYEQIKKNPKKYLGG